MSPTRPRSNHMSLLTRNIDTAVYWVFKSVVVVVMLLHKNLVNKGPSSGISNVWSLSENSKKILFI